MTAEWRDVEAALDRAAGQGRTIDVWLRDDDAIEATPELDRLAALSERYGLSVLLAVIPMGVTAGLRRRLDAWPLATATQHGVAHRNHAPVGERARELGSRAPEVVLAELAAARVRLADVLGPTAAILVPPWNRIDPEVVPNLSGLGFEALSTFGPPVLDRPDLPALNSDFDPVDWRGGRGLRASGKMLGELVSLVERAVETGAPLGLLTHHLAHDEDTWSFVERCVAQLAASPAVRFVSAETLVARRLTPSISG